MKLKLRFLLLMTAIFVVYVFITWLLSFELINQINQKWGSQFIERQVLFDKYRTLTPLIHEIELARKMAADPNIIQMALHESDPILKQRGIAAMENYRFNFRDHSYFAAIANSGNYYFNDAANQFRGRQLRYVLSQKNVNDKWFYATLADGKDYQVNLDPDIHLGVRLLQDSASQFPVVAVPDSSMACLSKKPKAKTIPFWNTVRSRCW
jgi:hypothetical protein